MEVEGGAVRGGGDHGRGGDHSRTRWTERCGQERIDGRVDGIHVREELRLVVPVGRMERFGRNGKVVSFFVVYMQYRVHVMSVYES